MTPAELKVWRHRHGLSQSELASLLGHPSSKRIEAWEQGANPIDPMLPLALCEVERRLK